MSGTLSLPTTGTFSGLTEQGYINAALVALANANAGASPPTAASTGLASTAGLLWHDTANNLLKLRDQADMTWVVIGSLNETTKLFTPYFGGAPLAVPSADGFVNRLRNNSLTSWFHGSSGTITTSGGWAAEGVYVVPTGASIAWSQATAGLPTACPTVNGLTLTGASAITDLKIRLVIESYDAAQLAGQACTFQLPIVNNTGGSITPTIATKYPTAQDNWTSSTNDLAAANLQTVANAATGVLSSTFNVAAGAVNGYEIIVDFGNNFASNAKSVTIGGGFDLRATPGAMTGLNSSPPTPEVRDVVSDQAWNARFYETTYNNRTAPGAATPNGMVFFYQETYVNPGWDAGGGAVGFKVRKRAAPTVTWYDAAGNASKLSAYFNTIRGDNISIPGSSTIGECGFEILASAAVGSGMPLLAHYVADATIIGA
ncbi:MAG TPA: hypothetical protein VGL83_16860 [Stellaceae bacterium]|jgi:hypothetical protein